MQQKPLVSIIVPVYNVEKYIAECLESLVKQTLQNIEIICVDDCGNDNSILIAKAFAETDDRIRIIHNPQNMGLGFTRNKGMKAAKGEYIGFVDSDDWVSPNFYDRLYKTAKKNNADICGASAIRDNGEILFLRKHSKKAKTLEEKFTLSNVCEYGCAWDKIFKHEFIQKNQIQIPAVRMWDDFQFCLPALFYANYFVTVPDAYYIYRDTPFSITKQQKFYDARTEAFQKMYDFARGHHFEDTFISFVSRLGAVEFSEKGAK